MTAGSPLNFLLAHWRLKLLALGLALTLVGAVAFSENPLITKTVRGVPISYAGLSPSLILLHPQTTLDVTVTGFSATLSEVGTGSITATVDASRLHHSRGTPPTVETVQIVARVLTSNVSLATSQVSIGVSVDDRATVQMPIEVKAPNIAPGWTLTKTQVLNDSGNQAQETVTGAASELAGLKAFAEVGSPIQNDVVDSPGAKVQFLDSSGKTLNWPPPTLPVTTSDPDFVTVHLEAKRPNQSRQVFLVVSTSGTPAPGFEIRNIVADPEQVEITGPADIISRYDSLTLPSLNVAGINSTRSFRLAIPLPTGVSSDTARVTVQVTVAPIPNATPAPTPSPSPGA